MLELSWIFVNPLVLCVQQMLGDIWVQVLQGTCPHRGARDNWQLRAADAISLVIIHTVILQFLFYLFGEARPPHYNHSRSMWWAKIPFVLLAVENVVRSVHSEPSEIQVWPRLAEHAVSVAMCLVEREPRYCYRGKAHEMRSFLIVDRLVAFIRHLLPHMVIVVQLDPADAFLEIHQFLRARDLWIIIKQYLPRLLKHLGVALGDGAKGARHVDDRDRRLVWQIPKHLREASAAAAAASTHRSAWFEPGVSSSVL